GSVFAAMAVACIPARRSSVVSRGGAAVFLVSSLHAVDSVVLARGGVGRPGAGPDDRTEGQDSSRAGNRPGRNAAVGDVGRQRRKEGLPARVRGALWGVEENGGGRYGCAFPSGWDGARWRLVVAARGGIPAGELGDHSAAEREDAQVGDAVRGGRPHRVRCGGSGFCGGRELGQPPLL